MEINILSKPDASCDKFVYQKAESTICHLFAWADKVVCKAGHRSYYLVAGEGGIVCGVLPLTYVHSHLFGNRMISQAFSNYGGILADSEEIRRLLFDRAVNLAIELNCQSIEFRNTEPMPYNLESHTEKISMRLSLDPDPDKIWQSFKPKIRNHVRKAEKSNIVAVSGSVELLDEFYRVYVIRMRQLGTPAYPRSLMYNILTAFPDNSRIFVVRLGKLTVGGGLTICVKGLAEIPWAATLVQYNALCPNNLLYWSIIKHYCLSGAMCFDFGRCTVDGSTYIFKKQWGSEPVNLYYEYWVPPGNKLSIANPNNPKYQKMVQIWKRLPLWLTRIVGPIISRNLP